MRSYNLFRRKGQEGLVCAVPESLAVPRFIGGGGWTFGGRVESPDRAPPGFDGRAAATAVRYNGFYLFQATGRGPA